MALPSLPKPATAPYPEPDELSQNSHTVSDPFEYYL
jgi:hypothetical protein